MSRVHERWESIALPSGAALHRGGASAGPAMLFLHGVGGGAWSWRPQSTHVAASRRVAVWEARGHGSAARVDDAGLSDYYADAREALALASDAGPVVVAGHSMGGLLAIALACEEPARVAGLFLVDPVYASSDSYGHFSPALGRVALWLCEPLLRSFARDGRTSRVLARWMFVHSFEDRDNMEAAWLEQRRQIPIEYPRMLRESFGIPTGFELRDFAAEIVAPTYLLEGSTGRDQPRFPALSDPLARRLGTRFSRRTIAGGHYLQLDRPEPVNAALDEFLARVD